MRQRGGGWVAIVDLGRDPFNNRRRQRWVSGFNTREAAEDALPGLLEEAERAPQAHSSRQSLGQFAQSWLDSLPTRGLRTTTIACYRTSITAHLLPSLGRMPLRRLTAMHLNQLYGQLVTSGRSDGRGGLSPRSVRLVHSIVRRMLADAVRWGSVAENVALVADPPRSRPLSAMRVWSAEELRRFLASLDRHPFRACFWLLATTGMRRGEALGLRWKDVDLDRGRLAIVQTLVQVPGGSQFSAPKTTRSRRTVALDAETVRVLRDHKREQARAGGLGELVFARAGGLPLLPHGVSKAFRSAIEAAGVPVIRLHDLRHGHASNALAAGVHPKVVSERLGHSTVAFTLDVYSHVVPAFDADAAETIAAFVRDVGLGLSALKLTSRSRACLQMKIAA